MPSNFARVATSALIWAAVSFVALSMRLSVSGFDAVVMVFLLMAAAAWATRAVWLADTPAMTATTTTPAEEAEKAKRRGSLRVRSLVDSLTDEELDELRARLMERDEQPVPLESLLPRRNRRSE